MDRLRSPFTPRVQRLPAERRRDGWTRDGIPLPHNHPWYDRYIEAGGKSSFEKF